MPSIAPFLKARQVHNDKRDKARALRRAKAVTMAARILTGEEFTNWTLAPDRSTITRFDSLSSDTRGARTYSLAGFQGQIDAQVKEILEARKKAAEAAEKAAAEAAAKTDDRNQVVHLAGSTEHLLRHVLRNIEVLPAVSPHGNKP